MREKSFVFFEKKHSLPYNKYEENGGKAC